MRGDERRRNSAPEAMKLDMIVSCIAARAAKGRSGGSRMSDPETCQGEMRKQKEGRADRMAGFQNLPAIPLESPADRTFRAGLLTGGLEHA